MRYKFTVVMVVVLFILFGCKKEQFIPKDKIKDVSVIDKKEKTYHRATSEYFITVEKNDNKSTFEVNESVYNAVEKGTIISANIYDDNFLDDITYPKLK